MAGAFVSVSGDASIFVVVSCEETSLIDSVAASVVETSVTTLVGEAIPQKSQLKFGQCP